MSIKSKTLLKEVIMEEKGSCTMLSKLQEGTSDDNPGMENNQPEVIVKISFGYGEGLGKTCPGCGGVKNYGLSHCTCK